MTDKEQFKEIVKKYEIYSKLQIHYRMKKGHITGVFLGYPFNHKVKVLEMLSGYKSEYCPIFLAKIYKKWLKEILEAEKEARKERTTKALVTAMRSSLLCRSREYYIGFDKAAEEEPANMSEKDFKDYLRGLGLERCKGLRVCSFPDMLCLTEHMEEYTRKVRQIAKSSSYSALVSFHSAYHKYYNEVIKELTKKEKQKQLQEIVRDTKYYHQPSEKVQQLEKYVEFIESNHTSFHDDPIARKTLGNARKDLVIIKNIITRYQNPTFL